MSPVELWSADLRGLAALHSRVSREASDVGRQRRKKLMGTRHLIAVQLDGKYRVAQYGQWDGYPDGQGKRVLEFLRCMNRPIFEEKLRALSFMTEEELKATKPEYDVLGSDGFYKNHPYWSRDAGAKVLEMIHFAPTGSIKLKGEIEFAGDSLICEYAYVIDLDADMLEVFKGSRNVAPAPGERFAETPAQGCYPIHLVAKYPLSALPDLKMMQRDVDPPEDEDADVSDLSSTATKE